MIPLHLHQELELGWNMAGLPLESYLLVKVDKPE